VTISNFNVPNSISVLRILMVPVLLFLAWNGHQAAFTGLLAVSLSTDILDGYLARRLNQMTRLGAQLDSWGDFLTVLTYPFAAIWLRPDALEANALYVLIALIAYFTPIAFGFIKFRRLTSYHARMTRVTAYAMGAAVIVFFAGWSDFPFRLACVFLVLAQAEQIVISALLPEWRENVRDFRHALALRREKETYFE